MVIRSKIRKSTLAKLALAGIASGALALSACDESTSSDGDKAAEQAAQIAQFQADCEAAGNTFEAHSCNKLNGCAGESFDVDKGTKTTHDCAEKSTCRGGTCRTS